MSALAELPDLSDHHPFDLSLGAGGEWIVRGPGDRCGGLFASKAAAEAFVRREKRDMPGGAALEARARHHLRLIDTSSGVAGGR